MFVATLLKSMPFQGNKSTYLGDEEEEAVALRCLMHLSQTNPELIKPYVKELTIIIENDLAAPKKYKLEGDFLVSVGSYLQALKTVA